LSDSGGGAGGMAMGQFKQVAASGGRGRVWPGLKSKPRNSTGHGPIFWFTRAIFLSGGIL
jgi:hypothetical protein